MADKKEKTKTYYHYTNEQGAQGIEKSGKIRQSTNTSIDAAFGTGVYLTDIPPSKSDVKILENNYDSAFRAIDKSQVSHVVEIKVPPKKQGKVEQQPTGRSVFLHKGELKLKDYKGKVYKREPEI